MTKLLVKPISNILMGSVNMSLKLPEIIVFAGPNGSGKSTITRLAKIIEPYINADDIKRSTQCSDLEAAIKAESLREYAFANKMSFTFETVLSTDRNLNLLRRAKENGFFIRCFYILTADVNVNIARVKSRVENGGHDVPEDKIKFAPVMLRLFLSFQHLLMFVMLCTFTTTPKRLNASSRNVKINFSIGKMYFGAR